MKYIYWILLFGLIITSCGKDQEVSIEQKIDRQLKALSLMGKPGVEVLVKMDSSLLYHKAFGKANLKTNEDLKINSVFDIASISKEFTAISILQLVEQGKLSLQDSLRKFLPNFPTEENVITIENLLSHSTGIKRHTNLSWAENEANKQFSNSYDVIQFFQKDSLDFKPGEQYSYRNMNYIILGYIIEQVSGRSYEEYIQTNIIDPLDMSETFFPKDGQSIASKPNGYEVKDSVFVSARPHSYTQSRGPGSIHSTANDLAKWYDGLINHKIISQASLQQAWSSFKLTNKGESNYGYGFFNDEKFGQTSIFHNGFIFGFSTSDLYFPKDDLLILVFSNLSDVSSINTNEIAFDIASIIYEGAQIQLDETILDSYVGTYLMDEGFKAKVYREGLVLFVELDGQPADELVANTKTKFRVKDFPAKVEFSQSSENGDMRMFLSNGPERYEGIKE